MRKNICLLICLLWGCNQGFSKTASECLELLIQGNQRYMKEALLHPNRSSLRREQTLLQQMPFATIIGCSDSRVSPEIIFDQGIGDLFIVRVAGNVVGILELDSIQYSVQNLGSSLLVVLGHGSCGAVTAVMEDKTESIKNIANLIKPAIYGSKTLEDAIKANVRSVVSELKKNKAIKKLITDKKIDCIGAYYHLGTGYVEILNPNIPNATQK